MITEEEIKQELESGKLSIDELIKSHIRVIENFHLAKIVLTGLEGRNGILNYYTISSERERHTFEELKNIVLEQTLKCEKEEEELRVKYES